MGQVLLGIITAALWFVLSQAANAERICNQVCDGGTCVSKCIDHPDDHPDSTVIIRNHDRDDRGPGANAHGPGVDIDVGR